MQTRPELSTAFAWTMSKRMLNCSSGQEHEAEATSMADSADGWGGGAEENDNRERSGRVCRRAGRWSHRYGGHGAA